MWSHLKIYYFFILVSIKKMVEKKTAIYRFILSHNIFHLPHLCGGAGGRGALESINTKGRAQRSVFFFYCTCVSWEHIAMKSLYVRLTYSTRSLLLTHSPLYLYVGTLNIYYSTLYAMRAQRRRHMGWAQVCAIEAAMGYDNDDAATWIRLWSSRIYKIHGVALVHYEILFRIE